MWHKLILKYVVHSYPLCLPFLISPSLPSLFPLFLHLFLPPLLLFHSSFLFVPNHPLLPLHTRYHTHSWYGVWTLLLLMYPRAVETSASLLFCPTLTNITNQSVMVGHVGHVARVPLRRRPPSQLREFMTFF